MIRRNYLIVSEVRFYDKSQSIILIAAKFYNKKFRIEAALTTWLHQRIVVVVTAMIIVT